MWTQITRLFTEEDKSVVVFLGADKKAKIKVGIEDFGVAIGAKTSDGSMATRTRMKYKISLSESERENCLKKLGKKQTLSLIKQETEQWINFDEYEGANVYAIISFNIPKGTAICSQKILIDVQDTETDTEVGGVSFTIQLLRRFL
jgi:hypothetical protein